MERVNQNPTDTREQPSETALAAFWEKEAAAWQKEAECWQKQAQSWQTQAMAPKGQTKSGSTQSMLPTSPRLPSLELQITEARERAWPTLLKVEVGDRVECQSGVFISSDGFFLTARKLKGKKCKMAGLFDTLFEYEHVKDFPILEVALMKVKGVTRVPFLVPIPSSSYCMPPNGMERSDYADSEWDIPRPVSISCRTHAAFPAGSAVLNPCMQIYKADGPLLGGPVLCLHSGYFLGVIFYSSEERTDMCTVAQSSLLWPEIESEMKKFREAGRD